MFGVVRTVGQLVVLLATMTTISMGAPPDASTRVSQLRAQLALRDLPVQSRSRILDELLDARSQLIRTQPDDAETIFWKTAQAEDAILQGLSLNALELIVRHGLPGQIQEEAFDRYVRLALQETRDLEKAVPGAIKAAPAGTDLLARLEALRDSRLPMLRGIALVLGSERNLVPDRDAALREGVRLLAVSVPTLRGNEEMVAYRQLALAKLAMGDEDDARSMLESLQRKDMDNQLENIGLRLALNEVVARVDGWGQAAGRAQLVAATNSDPLERLLLVEQAARCWMLTSRELIESDDPEQQALHVTVERNAIESFLLLLPEKGGLDFSDPRIVPLLIEERLGRLDIADLQASHIPDSVLIAKAAQLVESEDTALQAREMLLPLMDKSGMIPRARSRMMAMLVRSELTAGMDAAASEHAIEWSQIALSREEAFEGADLGMIHATLALQASPDDKELQSLLKQAISNMMENFPDHPKSDVWRLKAGEFAHRNGNKVDAMMIYATIPAESPIRPDAISKQAFLIVETALLEANRSAAIAAARARLSELKQALDEVNPKYREAIKRTTLGLDLCQARLDLLDGRPIDALDVLTRPGMDSIEPELAVYLYTARVDAAMATGREAAVEAVIDDLPFNVDAEVVLATLPGLLSIPGAPLPLDELQDPIQQIAALKLAIVLEASAESNITNRMLIIEALRRAGRCEEALVRLEKVLEFEPDLGDALFIKAECQRLDPQADQAEIIRIYTRLSKGEPAENTDRFWTSQLRLLQSMQSDARDSEKILARLNRLQRRYPDLGGPAYISEFAILRSELSPTP